MVAVKTNILTLGMLAILSTSALAQNKCVDAKGKVTYSDMPCPANALQRQMNLGGVGGEAPLATNGNTASTPALDKLNKEERRLKWVVEGAESDVRTAANSTANNDARRKLNIAHADLIRVQEQILQIKDPAAYQQYLKDKKERQRDQQLAETQRAANEANARAAAAEQSAQSANARAAAAEDAAAVADSRAGNAQNAAAAAQNAAAAAQGAAAAAQGAASRPLYCKGNYCY